MVRLTDEDAVHTAYVQHGPEIYRFLLRGLGDPGAAEDLTQETFLKAWRYADRFDEGVASLRAWLFSIARNAMIDHLRAARVRPWQRDLLDPASPKVTESEVGDATERLLEQWVVEEALRRIPEHHRTVLVQTHLRDRPYDEVGAELGLPVGTVRSRVFYGLKALRSALDEMGVTL